ncbi:hypothetical protein B296_00003144 [Ensete ventricosum]|uniref:Uncharacterized protein n=1 Tax=Ensete ventricosum TaxID=4639 RepID=A0A427B290_ENSVE|nr:hypothetical protein B296_00003144 [Ensete ventricosum]
MEFIGVSILEITLGGLRLATRFMAGSFLRKSDNFWCFFTGEVIELKDVVLRRGVAIAFSDVVALSIVDTLEEIGKGDGLFTSVTSRVLVGIKGYGGQGGRVVMIVSNASSCYTRDC